MNIDKLCRVVEDELQKIAEKGLNTSNLETAYKLIDMYKDLKNTEFWESQMEDFEMGYSENGYGMNDDYPDRGRNTKSRYPNEDGGNSYAYRKKGGRRRGEHYVRGHYSRNGGYSESSYGVGDPYDMYIQSKQSYRDGKSPDCKKRLMDSLEEYMEDFSEQMEEMLRDADCQEERETIERYIKKIKSIV